MSDNVRVLSAMLTQTDDAELLGRSVAPEVKE